MFSESSLNRKKFDSIKYNIDLIQRKEMVSSPKIFDVLKYEKMTKLAQTKHICGILAGFTHNIAYQTGFEISTGNTTHSLCHLGRLTGKLIQNKELNRETNSSFHG